MAARASISNLRVTPRKARMVADLIRGLGVQKALDILAFNKRRVAQDFKKLIRSALANAEQDGRLDPDQLYLQTVTVDQGPMIKRGRARSRGMSSPIQKKTSHVAVILSER